MSSAYQIFLSSISRKYSASKTFILSLCRILENTLTYEETMMKTKKLFFLWFILLFSVSQVLFAQRSMYDISKATAYEFDSSNSDYPSLEKIDDTHFLCAYDDGVNDGWVVLLYVNPTTGAITKQASLEFETSNGETPYLKKVDSTHFLCVYEASGSNGRAIIFTVNVNNSTITQGTTYEFESGICHDPTLSQIDNTHFLCAYQGGGYDGWASVLEINTNTWTITEKSEFEFDGDRGTNPALEKIDSNHFLCVYEGYDTGGGGSEDGWSCILEVNLATWEISNRSSYEFDILLGEAPAVIKIDNSHYLCTYNGYDSGTDGDDGWSLVLTVNNVTWAITGNTKYEYDTSRGIFSSLAQVDDNHFLCTYEGLNSDGWAKVLEINTGTWSISTSSSFEYDTSKGEDPALVSIDYEHFLCAFEGSGDNGWAVRLKVQGIENLSTVTAPSPQIPTGNVPSIADTPAEAVNVFKFRINDNVGNDGLPTKVTQITIKPGTNNTADWTDNLQGITLFGNSSIPLENCDITDNEIVIGITPESLDVPNNSSQEVTMAVYLHTSNIQDNAILQFFIDADAHGFEAHPSGSGFASTFPADVISNNFTITITAKKLVFSPDKPPSEIVMNENFDVEVSATDENGNRDFDAATSITLQKVSGEGTISSETGLMQNLEYGIYEWTDVQYDNTGFFTIRASDNLGILTEVISDPIFSVKNPEPGDVYITEVCDNKPDLIDETTGFIEIYNNTDFLIDMSGCKIVRTQGGSPDGFEFILPVGFLSPKKMLIVACGSDIANFEYIWDVDLSELEAIYSNGDVELLITTDRGYVLYNVLEEVLDNTDEDIPEFFRDLQIGADAWVRGLDCSDGTPGRLDLLPPQNFKISIEEEFVIIKWCAVFGASYYNIYSSIEPYQPYPWFLEESGIIEAFWIEIIGGDEERKFYYVTVTAE